MQRDVGKVEGGGGIVDRARRALPLLSKLFLRHVFQVHYDLSEQTLVFVKHEPYATPFPAPHLSPRRHEQALEEQNLFFIQNSQETEHALDELKQNFGKVQKTMDTKTQVGYDARYVVRRVPSLFFIPLSARSSEAYFAQKQGNQEGGPREWVALRLCLPPPLAKKSCFVCCSERFAPISFDSLIACSTKESSTRWHTSPLPSSSCKFYFFL